MLCPILDGTWGRFKCGFLPVNISNGDGSVDEIGVVQYCRRPNSMVFPLSKISKTFFHNLSLDFITSKSTNNVVSEHFVLSEPLCNQLVPLTSKLSCESPLNSSSLEIVS